MRCDPLASVLANRGEDSGRLVVGTMLDAAIVVDANGAIAEVNPAFEALSGWSEPDLVGQPLDWIYLAEGGEQSDDPSSSAFASASHSDAAVRTHRYRCRDGGFFWGETAVLPLSGDDRASRGSIQLIRDVSARVWHEERLRELVAFFANAADRDDHDLPKLLDLGCRYFGLQLGVFIRPGEGCDHVEAVGGDLDSMKAGQVLSGRDRISSMLPCDRGTATIENGGGAAASTNECHQRTSLETLLACAVPGADRCHGTLYFGGRRLRQIDGQQQQVLQLMALWVAASKDAELAEAVCEENASRLQAGEERYRVLYRNTPAMMHSIDASGRLINVSNAWLTKMGYQRDEVIGRRSTEFLTAASRLYAENVVLPAFYLAGRCDNVEYKAVTKEGDVLDLLLSAIALKDEDGNFQQSLAISTDLTDRRQVEQKLIEKTEALKRSNADLARFAHIASHDLQEPLRRIIAYSEILKEDYGPELSDSAAEIAGIIQSGGRRLRLMINDLLAYVRLSEQLDRGFEPVDLSAVLCHALDDLKDEIEARSVRIHVAQLPLVWGRAPLLRMVLYHLLSNAIKFSGEQSPRIDISVEKASAFWQFAVSDKGIGIEPRFADRIFEIFQRLHLKDERGGSGAGLAICRLIIQSCGGDIWLDRSYEDGARFLFTLPKDRPEAPGETPTSSQVPPSEIDIILE
ncbi:MAG: PAS domain-containing sensor histidine kinase [Geminicoccaceae bacterium]